MEFVVTGIQFGYTIGQDNLSRTEFDPIQEE